jgi:hypothetical protein
VGASVVMQVRHVVVLIDDVGVGVAVVVGPGLAVVTVAVVAPVGVLTPVTVIVSVVAVVVSVVVAVANGSEVSVVLGGLVGVVLGEVTLGVLAVPAVSVVEALVAVVISVTGSDLVSLWLIGSGVRGLKVVMNISLDIVALVLVARKLVSNSVAGVMVVTEMGANIGVVMVVKVDLSAVVVRLHVDIVSHGVVLDLMHGGIVVHVVVTVAPNVSVVGVMVHVVGVVNGSMEKVMNTMASVIHRWVVDGSFNMGIGVMVVMELIEVSLRMVTKRVLVDVVPVVGLDVGSLMGGAAEVACLPIRGGLVPVVLGGGDASDCEHNE